MVPTDFHSAMAAHTKAKAFKVCHLHREGAGCWLPRPPTEKLNFNSEDEECSGGLDKEEEGEELVWLTADVGFTSFTQ